MTISQHKATSLLNHTIFRPGWRVSARPASDGRVLARFEIETVDSSLVTRGGEYKVPLTERALILLRPGDYEAPEALLFRVLAFIGELQVHEDREFLRTWDAEAERWAAPFHSHAPGSAQAWNRMRALPLPAIERISVSDDGPWAVNAGCDMEEDRGDCWESGNGRKPLTATGCSDGINDQDCWENGKRALVQATPCNEQVDDDDGPQRVLADADCTLGPPERLARAGCAQDGEVNCNTNIDTLRVPVNAGCADGIDIDESGCNTNGRVPALAGVAARAAARRDPCTEDHGGCAEWG